MKTKLTQKEFDKLPRGKWLSTLVPANSDLTLIKFFPTNSQFGRDCLFGDNHTFGDRCKFDKGSKFGNFNRFDSRTEFAKNTEFGDDNKFGYDSKFGDNNKFGNDSHFGEYNIFGNNNIFGNDCNYKMECEFGSNTKFGNDCDIPARIDPRPFYDQKPQRKIVSPVKQIQEIIGNEENIYRHFYKGFEFWIKRPRFLVVSEIDKYTSFHLCGYVVIDRNSEYFKGESFENYDIDCYDNLTFAGSFEELSVDFAVGFGSVICSSTDNTTYKNYKFVKLECEKIIDQLLINK